MTKFTFGGFGLCVLMGALLQPSDLLCCMPSATDQSGPLQSGKMVTTQSPFYCNMGVYTPEQRKRKNELDKSFRTTAQAYRELENGYEFQFPAEAKSIQTIAEWSAMERFCCPFFDIDLRMDREGGPFWLRLSGRDGVKQFIQADFKVLTDHLASQK
jgi:hypothetical protein